MSTQLLDARPLRLVHRRPVRSRDRSRSLYWLQVDSQPCVCGTLHGHCGVVACACPRHEGEIGAA